MKFGFSLDRTSIQTDDFCLKAVSNFEDVKSWFYTNVNVANGWIYGPSVQLKQNLEEQSRFRSKCPCRSASFYQLPATHELTSYRHQCDTYLTFLILGYSFLQGLYLCPERHLYLGKVPYNPSTLNGLSLNGADYERGMALVSQFYFMSDDEIRKQMSACIHWFLIGQTLEFPWDKFDAQYKVLDGIYKLSGLRSANHASRAIDLARKFNIKLPNWAELDSSGKYSTLSKLRNSLVHEAKFAGEAIGYALPKENYSLEFAAFNTKLIAASLGINTPYLTASPENRAIWGWDIAS